MFIIYNKATYNAPTGIFWIELHTIWHLVLVISPEESNSNTSYRQRKMEVKRPLILKWNSLIVWCRAKLHRRLSDMQFNRQRDIPRSISVAKTTRMIYPRKPSLRLWGETGIKCLNRECTHLPEVLQIKRNIVYVICDLCKSRLKLWYGLLGD